AQPGDENIRFVRQLGPYDAYAIEWGYRHYESKSLEEETKTLKAFVDAKSLDPMYMFGGRGNDPNAQTENIGDDPIKASGYGIKNLKIVAKNLPQWTLTEGDHYDELEELYGEMVGVYRRYIYHVHNIVGGVNETLHNTNQKGVTTYVNTPKANQLAALNFLNRELWNTPNWLMDPQLVSNFKSEGSLKTIQNLQRAALNRFLSVKKLNRMLSTSQTLLGIALSVEELLNTLYTQLFKNREQPDSYERALQLHFISQVKSLIEEEKLHPEIKALLTMHQSNIYKWSKKKKGTSNMTLKAHFQYCYEQSSAK
ncbi:MAG: zinc-dependent metalloprotease, partial [Flavobacteriaceae bacterium]|nr:zinc-dependent metalloprotease [Flavobacteriaceae bacterium]